MPFQITQATRQSLSKIKKEPVLVVEFDGIDTLIGSAKILQIIKVGDPGLTIGGGWKIGGKAPISNQIDAITFSSNFGSTTTSIDFKLDPDKGRGESVTSMTLAFLDTKANDVLSIVSNNEMLGRRVRVLLAPDPIDNLFPQDYITVFRGMVDSIDLPPEGVVFTVSHPDQKKRQSIFVSKESALTGSITNSSASMPLTSGDAASMLQRINGPDGLPDASFSGYVRVDDEIIRYTGFSGDLLTGLVRGQLGTTAVSHASGASVTSFYRLEGNAIDLALKIMLSGKAGNYAEFVAVKGFNYINNSATETVPNSIFFYNINLQEIYGVVAGDYITTEGSDFPASNDVTAKRIESVNLTSEGTYLVIEGVTFVDEMLPDLSLQIYASFRSQYDTLPDGLGMFPSEVDVLEHERIRDNFISSVNYDFYLTETIDNGKEFIEQQLYSPISCYSSPRKARSSLAFTIGPLPNAAAVTLDVNNVKNADKLVKRRSIGRNFYNTIIYKYDESAIESGKFLRGTIEVDATSLSTIDVGTRALTLEARGFRVSNAPEIDSFAGRRIRRYAFGAEYFENVRTTFGAGYTIEVGDLVILDGVTLKIANPTTGLRTTPPRYYEVVSKKIDIQTGDTAFGLLDTRFDTTQRYALISPSSLIRNGISASAFILEGEDEFEKWDRYGSITVRVRSVDYSVADTAVVDRYEGNTVYLNSALSFTPSADMIMELSDYNDANAEIKLLYGFISNGTADFDDGEPPYIMI
jgi:hypothetical protein